MPMPKRRQGESESDFVSRFVADPAMIQEYPEQSQRLAIAYSQFEKKSDEGDASMLTQEVLDSLEKKEFVFEVKAIDEKKGIIKGIASPYNNIDNGGDRVRPTIATRNVGKWVPFLLQHTMGTEQGKVRFYDSKEGLMGEIHLYMDKLENGHPIFPEAFRTYIIAQNGMLKLSIGYNTLKFKNTIESGIPIRDLIDIDIKELSRVTIPMNPKAVATEVKQEGGHSMPMVTLRKRMEGEMARRQMGILMNAMRDSTYHMMNGSDMTKDQRQIFAGQCADEFSAMYKEYAKQMIEAMPDGEMKSDELDLEIKKFDDLLLETKAGAKFSKKSKAEMKKLYGEMMKAADMLKGMIGEEGKAGDDDLETKSDGEPKDPENPGETKNDGDLENQAAILEALKGITENLSNKEDN